MKLEKRVRSIGHFLDAVREIRSTWQIESRKELWFRGEGADYLDSKLRPALYRRHEPWALKSPSDLIDIEDDLFEYFRRNSTELAEKELLRVASADPWETYFLMQHYGAPTRLLDFSDGALIALHFALRENRSNDRVVYVVDPYWLMDHIEAKTGDHQAAREAWVGFCRKYPSKGLDEDDWDDCWLPNDNGHSEVPVPDFPLVLEFDHFVRRVSAQRSRFVLMGTAPDFFNRLFEYSEARLAAIWIPDEDASEIRTELRDAGVTESVIFPDLDGLGREVQQLWAERLRNPI